MGYYRYYGYYLPWFFLASSSGGLTVRSSDSHARHPPRTILMTLRPTSEPPTLVPTNGPSQFPTLVPTSAPEPPVTVSAGGAYTAQTCGQTRPTQHRHVAIRRTRSERSSAPVTLRGRFGAVL
jgi:hypothetical protein